VPSPRRSRIGERVFRHALVRGMAQQGYTTRNLARALGVTVQCVWLWRRGRSLPDLYWFCRLRQIFGWENEELMALMDRLCQGSPLPRRSGARSGRSPPGS
jgi:DNA-binding XRE family transcriptional regulator